MKKLLVVLAIFLAITIIFCSSNAYSKRTIQQVESYETLDSGGKQKNITSYIQRKIDQEGWRVVSITPIEGCGAAVGGVTYYVIVLYEKEEN